MLNLLSMTLHFESGKKNDISKIIDGKVEKDLMVFINGVFFDQKMKMHQLATSKKDNGNLEVILSLRDENYIIDDSCHDKDYNI